MYTRTCKLFVQTDYLLLVQRFARLTAQGVPQIHCCLVLWLNWLLLLLFRTFTRTRRIGTKCSKWGHLFPGRLI